MADREGLRAVITRESERVFLDDPATARFCFHDFFKGNCFSSETCWFPPMRYLLNTAQWSGNAFGFKLHL